jgi:hypothetical protein
MALAVMPLQSGEWMVRAMFLGISTTKWRGWRGRRNGVKEMLQDPQRRELLARLRTPTELCTFRLQGPLQRARRNLLVRVVCMEVHQQGGQRRDILAHWRTPTELRTSRLLGPLQLTRKNLLVRMVWMEVHQQGGQRRELLAHWRMPTELRLLRPLQSARKNLLVRMKVHQQGGRGGWMGAG